MTVNALLTDGSALPLSAHYGATVDDVVKALTLNTLTGSAVPLADEMVELADGGTIPYGDIAALVNA